MANIDDGLAEGTTRLTNVPDIVDVSIMGMVLHGLGATVGLAAPSTIG